MVTRYWLWDKVYRFSTGNGQKDKRKSGEAELRAAEHTNRNLILSFRRNLFS
jgi:hypothetical protein